VWAEHSGDLPPAVDLAQLDLPARYIEPLRLRWVIMLVGIVKKNAIMMIDFAIEAQRSGKSAAEAI
jgi:hypothetical protein